MVHGRAQHYAWGDDRRFLEMLGQPPMAARGPSGRWAPTAAASRLADGHTAGSGRRRPAVSRQAHGRSRAASLQKHPDRAQAEAGFARRAGWASHATRPDTIYQRPVAKPEMLWPVTTSTRSADSARRRHRLAASRNRCSRPRHFLPREKLPRNRRGPVPRRVRQHSDPPGPPPPPSTPSRRARGTIVSRPHWSPSSRTNYPGDPSVVVTLLFDRVLGLGPGEAVFLGPGNLHAYLCGFGVEVMANSDNVVRGGMTVKHVESKNARQSSTSSPWSTQGPGHPDRAGTLAVRNPEHAFPRDAIIAGRWSATAPPRQGPRAAAVGQRFPRRRVPLPGARRADRPARPRHRLPHRRGIGRSRVVHRVSAYPYGLPRLQSQ